MRRKRWLTISLSLSLLFSTVPADTIFAKTHRIHSDLQTEMNQTPESTEEWMLQQEVHEVEAEGDDETDPSVIPTFTEDMIREISWETLSPEAVVSMYHEFTRDTLMIAAYFYSDLRRFLSRNERQTILGYNDQQALTLAEQLPEEQRTKLYTYLPAIQQLKQHRDNGGEGDKLEDVSGTGIKYTEKDMKHVYEVRTSLKPVDDFYHTATVTETDLHLQGKHGMDLVIRRTYNSLNSKTKKPAVVQISDDEWDNQLEQFDLSEEYVPFAAGWSFNLPSFEYVDNIAVETVTFEGDHTTYSLEPPDDDHYRYTINLDDGRTLIYENGKFVNYPYNDAQLTEYADPTELDLIIGGYMYHFEDQGYRMDVTKTNPFGDTITFTYRKDDTNAVTITDTYGRVVKMTRSSNGGAINRLRVYKSSSSTTVLKDVAYNMTYSNTTNPNSGYAQLDSVTEGTPSDMRNVAQYAYDVRYTEFNFRSTYTFPEDASYNFEYSGYRTTDDDTRETVNYLLLKKVTYPVSGLTIDYAYSLYNSGNPMENRGVVRLYQDDNILSYITYHPVTEVTYSYAPYGQSFQPMFFKEYQMRAKGAGKVSWEIWKSPKTWVFHRLHDVGNRSGDIVVNNVEESYRYNIENTFESDKSGNHLLRRQKTTSTADYPFLQKSDSGVSYSYNPITYVTYAYKIDDVNATPRGSIKPSFMFEFVENQSDPQVYQFLMNPQVNSNGTLGFDQTRLSQYARITEFQYDAYGNLTKQVEPTGQVTDYTYNSYTVWETANAYRPVRSVSMRSQDGSLSEQHVYTYEAGTLLLDTETETHTYQTENGTVTDQVIRDYDYNANKQISKLTEMGSGGKTGTTQPTLVTFFDQYDSFGHVTVKRYQGINVGDSTKDLTERYTYVDGLDLLDIQTFPDSSRVDYDYDGLNRVTKEAFTNGTATKEISYSYDDSQRKVTKAVRVNGSSDPNGYRLTTYYTPQGDIEYQEEVTNVGSRPLIRNEYSTRFDGRLVRATYPYNLTSRKISYDYYSDGSLKSETNALGQVTSYNYANTGTGGSGTFLQKAVEVRKPNGQVITSYYDRNGWLVKTVDATGDGEQTRTTTMSYDGFGRMTAQTVTNQAGETRRSYYKYDLRNQLLYLKDAENNQYSYDYDVFGNLLQIKENGTVTTKSVYNALSWKLREDDVPGGQQERYAYYDTGDLRVYTDKAGNRHETFYTPLYEVARQTVTKADGTQTYTDNYEYEPVRRLLKKQSNSTGQSIEYTYDAYRRMDSFTVFNRTYRIGYNDGDDWMDTLTYANGPTVSYGYDNLGRITSVNSTIMGTVSYSYALDSTGESKTTSYPGLPGMEERFNSFGEIKWMKHLQNGSPIWTETQQFDGFGNIKAITRNGVTYGYTYYKNDRLRSETKGTETKTYNYDSRGNRSTLTGTASSYTGTTTFTYDLKNRVKTFTVNGTNGSYDYFPDGLRAKKTANGQTTQYVYLNGKVIEELDGSGSVTARNIWGDELIYRETYRSGTKEKGGYYYYNSHGDVVKIVDAAGNLLNRYDYDAWGNIDGATLQETMSNPFTYTGEMYDKETGLYYLRARYYDPQVGRFISEDTYKGQVDNPLSLNRYTYTHNNPLRYVDRNGHEISEPWGNGGINKDENGILRTQSGKGNVYWDYYNKQYKSKGVNSVPQQIRTEFTGNATDSLAWMNNPYVQGISIALGMFTGTGELQLASKAVNLGKTYKNLGTVVANSPINKITGISQQNAGHFIERVIERGISPQTILDTLRNPTVITSQWKGERFAYITQEAVIIVDKTGKLVTGWLKEDFTDAVRQVLKEAGN